MRDSIDTALAHSIDSGYCFQFRFPVRPARSAIVHVNEIVISSPVSLRVPVTVHI